MKEIISVIGDKYVNLEEMCKLLEEICDGKSDLSVKERVNLKLFLDKLADSPDFAVKVSRNFGYNNTSTLDTKLLELEYLGKVDIIKGVSYMKYDKLTNLYSYYEMDNLILENISNNIAKRILKDSGYIFNILKFESSLNNE